jgi:hypothetical protein
MKSVKPARNRLVRGKKGRDVTTRFYLGFVIAVPASGGRRTPEAEAVEVPCILKRSGQLQVARKLWRVARLSGKMQ